MLKKTIPLLALTAITTFNASAAEKLEPFIGVDIGTRLSGNFESSYDESKTETDLADSLAFGIEGGVTLNEAHQISVGYDYRGTTEEHTSDDLEVGTIYTKYNYLVPITQKLAWTVGGKLGYEKFYADFDADDFNGLVIGGQTGLNYRFNTWSVGTELSYLHHTNEFERKWSESGTQHTTSAKIGDEVLLMANIKYNF
ncbi:MULTISPECIES: outer membrane beta-barrel protein [Salinivibrio]|uniref:outer membrane beta-barrel protein n=1 Tax=Salinivibrio TaxID=51366 RepID=UPI00098726E2|nr:MULTISPECIES: outer membrane beta-barrel protein [Salinivibrio]OOF08235.1 transcriptional regulator [Salinivibrio sp. PR919]OOF14998.1 transcriptional regulator [Salinivibrio sp. PR932]OOF30383.1 transcriptional regulator [Salinivibrio proteolyticus]